MTVGPFLPFLPIFFMNVLVVILFLSQDRFHILMPFDANIQAAICILSLIGLLLLGLYWLTRKGLGSYAVSYLIGLFELSFVVTQYFLCKAYLTAGLHSP